MKMKKILSLIIAVLMIMGTMAVSVSAEENVAKIGDTYYPTFDAALNAANATGDTIELTTDIANLSVTVKKDITIDLGKNTLTDAYIRVYKNVEIKNGKIVNTQQSYPLVVEDGGKLTVVDVDIEASKSDRAIWVRDDGFLDFKSGSILATKGANNTYSTIYGICVGEGSTVNIYDGTITVDAGSEATAVAVFGNYDNTVNMIDGKLSTSGKNYSYGIYTSGNITVSGGEIVTNEKQYAGTSGVTNGYNYALYTKKNVTITGGTITTYGHRGYLVNGGSSGQNIAISGVTFENVLSEIDKEKGHTAPPVVKASNATVTISSGTFYGVSENENEIVQGSNNTKDTSGGTFSSAPAPAETTGVAKIGDTTYGDLASALKALKAGDTLEILRDITITEAWNSRAGDTASGTITVPVIIDGGNHTIKFACDVSDNNNYHAPIRATADIVVKNLTMDLSEASNSKDTTRIRALAFTSSAEITNCTFIGNGYTRGRGICFGEGATAENLSKATVTITGCNFKNWSQGIIDNESGKREVKAVSITGSIFENAGINVSASESVVVTGNTVTGAWVKITSYTQPDTCEVTATGNTLTENANSTNSNQINSGKIIAVQEGFVVPVATTLPEAVDGVITLTEDVVLKAPYTVAANETLTIDLNGKTITYNSTTQNEAMITNKGNLTIKDSVGTGVINYNYTGAADGSYGKGNYTISNAGTLTVNGGKITIANLSGHAKYPIDNNSTTGDAILVIKGGHLYNYNTSAIRQFCNSTTNKNSVTIEGGVIEGYSAIWVQNPGSNTVNGSLSITGGEIRTTAKAWVNGTAELEDVSSAIYCTIAGQGGAWSEDSAVSITGGIINENVYLAEDAPAAITIGDEATFNGYVAVPEEEVDKTLPNAEVKNLGSVTIPAGKYSCYPSGSTDKDLELDVAMQFIAKDTPEEAAENYYGNYTTDFFIEFSGIEGGSFDTTGCYLAGNYGDWGWIAIPVDGIIETVEEGVVYPVLSGATPLDFKYVDICAEVKDFTCGIYFSDAVKSANPNLTVELSLGLSENVEAARNAQFTTVGAYEYDKEDFGKQLVNWGTGTDAGFYMDGETKQGMMRFLFYADVDAKDIIDSGIKYVRTDNITASVVSKSGEEATNAFYGDVTGIPEGTAGEYAAVAYVITSKGLIYWSDATVCSPNFTKLFTEYNPAQ